MTVSSTTTRADYNGNGVTTVFAVPFYFLDSTHLKVLRTVISTGVSTTLTLGTDYTVTGAGVSTGGSITCTTAPASTVKISILRNVPYTQLTHYVENDPFPAASHEQALDQLTMEVQQLGEAAVRALTFPQSDSGVSGTLPTAAQRANQYLAFDANGNPVVAASVPSNLYYGAYASNPSTRPDASAIQVGDMYFNTTYNVLYIYTNGFGWLSTAANLSNFTTQTFSGTGAQTAFTLSGAPYSVAALEVFISGVRQVPGTDYTLSGVTLTFTSAPPTGTGNIFALWMSVSSIGVPTSGTVGAAALDTSSASGTGAMEVPYGTTAQRPAAPSKPILRYNSTTGQYEGWNIGASAWTSVGGGASGGGSNAVFILNDTTVTTSYSIPSGKNAGTFGPITINDGVTVTIPDGSVWTVV